MSLEDSIKGAMLNLLKEYDIDAVEVTYFEDSTRSGGGCDTCWYDYAVVEIRYIDSNGSRKVYVYEGAFGDLIRALG